MSSPFVGEIRMFAGNFAPSGWLFCNGALVPIAENDVLFQLLGTTYGGDGQTTFGLPDLRGRVPLMQGTQSSQTFTLGQLAGQESTTLTTQQIPSHAHYVNADGTTANSSTPANSLPGTPGAGSTPTYYISAASTPSTFASQAMGGNAGGLPIPLIQPILAVNFIISQFGIFPSQN